MSTVTAPPTSLSDLKTALDGRLVTVHDPDWDEIRQVFNLTTDLRPAAILLARGPGDVVTAMELAPLLGLRVAAQATGHNASAYGDLSDTLLVDVRDLREVHIDASRCQVRVGAGVRWQDVVPHLSELGLAALHGSSPLVGIAGYSLGGGIGWLARKHGMQTNSVTAFEVVTPDAVLRRVSAEQDADLFWALRGGNGSYGVVTAIEFRVYRVPALYAGAAFFPLDRARELLTVWTSVTPNLPEELMTWVQLMRFPDAPELPEPLRGGEFAVLLGAYLGDADSGAALLAPLRDLGPVMDTFAAARPADLAELAMDPPAPVPFASTTALVDGLDAGSIERLVDLVGAGSGSALPLVQIRQMGGALSRAEVGAGARATLAGEFCVFALGVAADPASTEATHRDLVAIERLLAPSRVGHYPNFVEDSGSDVRAFWDAETWARLTAVKAAYDPADLVRGNHHLPPVAGR
jgi:FAD/FMN-containing dehydrogenase